MSEIAGSLSIELLLDRSRFDRDLQSLQSIKGGAIALQATLDTRALRQQINNLSQLKPTIAAQIQITNLNQVEQQLRVLGRDRNIRLAIDTSPIDRVEARLNALSNRTVTVSIALDESGFSRLDRRLRQYGDRTFKLTAQVDDSRLTALNKHLDLKQKHFTQVNNYMSSRPLTPKADLSGLDRLDKRLNDFRDRKFEIGADISKAQAAITSLKRDLQGDLAVTVRYANTQAPTQSTTQSAPQRVAFDASGIETSITKGLNNSLNKFEESFSKSIGKIGKGNPLKGLGDILTAPLQLAVNAAGSVLSGVGLGIGEQISKDLGKGLAEGIDDQLAPIIGSFRLVGREAASALTRELVSALGQDAELVQKVVSDLIGKDKILVESGSTRGRQKQAQQARTVEATRFFQQEASSTSISALKSEQARLNQQFSDVAKLRAELDRKVKATAEGIAKRTGKENIPGQIAQLGERSRVVRSEVADLNTRAAQQIESNTAARTRLSKLEQTPRGERTEADNAEIGRLQEQIRTGEASLKTLQSQAVEKSRAAQQLSGQITNLTSALETITQLAEDVYRAESERIQEIEEKLATAKQQLDRKLQPFEALETLGQIQDPTRIDGAISQRRQSIATLQQRQGTVREGILSDSRSIRDLNQQKAQELEKPEPERDLAKLNDLNRLIEKLKIRQGQRKDLYERFGQEIAREEAQLRSLTAQAAQPLAVQSKAENLSKTLATLKQKEDAIYQEAQRALAAGEEARAKQLLEERKKYVAAQQDLRDQLALMGVAPIKQQPAVPVAPMQAPAAQQPAPPPKVEQPAPKTSVGRPLPPTMRKILNEVAAISGVEVPEDLVPRLNVSNEIKGTGQYDPETNTLNLSAAIAKELAASGFSEEITAVIVHEFRHALQSGFGQVNAMRGSAVELTTPTESELAAAPVVRGRTLQQRIDGSTQLAIERNPGKEDLVRRVVTPLEADAYAFENRYAGQIYQKVTGQSAAAESVPDPWADMPTAIEKATPTQQKQQQNQKGKGLDVTVDMDRLGDIAYQTGATIKAVGDAGKKVVSVFRVMANSDAGQAFIGGVGNATKSVFAVAKAGYKVASAMEAIALDFVPAGRTAKGVLKQTAVPALMFGAATQFLPGAEVAASGLSQAIGGVVNPLMQGLGGAASNQAAGLIAQAIPQTTTFFGQQVPNMLAPAAAPLTSAVSGAIQAGASTVGEMIVQAGTVILGGKVLQGIAGNTLKSALPPAESKALAPAPSKALPQAPVVDVTPAAALLPAPKVTPQAEVLTDPFAGLTNPQLLNAARRLGIKGVNSKSDKESLLNSLKGYRDQNEVDRMIEAVRAEIGRDGKPLAGVDKAAEKEALKRLAKAEKSVNSKLAQLQKATGAKREKLINEILASSQSAIAEIDQLKAQPFSGEAIRSLSLTQGRLENTIRNNPTLNEARQERIANVQRSASDAARQRNITGLARVDAAEAEVATLGATLKAGIRKLTNFAAKQFDVVPQASIRGTLGQIARSPKAIDLAVNTAGFAASKLGEQYGVIPEMTGDLVGALVARQLLSRGRPNAKDLTGDVAGFAVGNIASKSINAGLDALTGVVPGAGVLRAIPFKGAAVASAVVPKIQKQAEQFQPPEIEGLARVGGGSLKDKFRALLPNNQRKAERLKANYEAIYREIATLSGVAFDPANVPKLAIDGQRLKQMGAKAFYDIERNTILIDERLASILSRRAGALKGYADQIANLTHEGRHSLQLMGGKLSLEEAASGAGVPLMSGERLTARQRSQVAGSVEVARRQGLNNGQLNAVQALESDAYAFEGNTANILARVAPQGLFGRLKGLFGKRPAASPEIAAQLEQLDRTVSEAANKRVQERLRELEVEVAAPIEQAPKAPTPKPQAPSRLTPQQKATLKNIETGVEVNDRFADLPVSSLAASLKFDAAAAKIERRGDRIGQRIESGTQPSLKDRFREQVAPEAAEYLKAAKQGIGQLGLGGIFKGANSALPLVNDGLKLLISNLGAVVKGFVGFTVISSILPQLQSFVSESVKAAVAVDRLKTSLNFSTGNAPKALEFVKGEANRLGLSLTAAQDGFAQLAGSTRGTAVQGKATDELFSGVGAASAVLGLTGDQQGRIFNALSQTASKGKLSAEELRGQIGDAGLVGSFGIAARSLGISEAELNKRLEQGAVTAEEFLPKFGRQLQIEFGGAAESAAGGTQANLNRLDSNFKLLQQSAGQAFTPAVNTGAAALAGTLGALADKGGELTKVLLTLGGVIGAAFLAPLAQSVLSLAAVQKGLGLVATGAGAVGANFKALALQFVAITAAIEAVRSFAEIFQVDETTKQFEGLARSGESSLKRIEDAAKRARGEVDKVPDAPKRSGSKGFDLTLGLGKLTGLEDVGFSLKTDDFLKTANRFGFGLGDQIGNLSSRLSGGRFELRPGTTVEELQQQLRSIGLNDALGDANDLIGRVYDAGSRNRINDALAQASSIDTQITQKQNERSRLAAQPRPDRGAIAKVDTEIKSLNEQRSKVTGETTELQAGIQGQLTGLKAQLNNTDLSKDERANIERTIAQLEKAQASLGKMQGKFGTAADRVNDLRRALAELNIGLEQVQRNAEVQFNIQTREDINAQLAAFGTDKNASLNASVNAAQRQEARTNAQLEGNQRLLDEIAPKLNTPEAEGVLASVVNTTTGKAITKDSSIAEIERARAGLADSDSRKKLLDDLVAYKKALDQQTGLEAQAAQDRLAVREAEQQRKLALIDREAQERDLVSKKSLSLEQVDLISKQKTKSISEEDAAIKSAQLNQQQTSDDLSNAQTQLGALQAAFDAGEISAEQFAQKRIELENKVSDLTIKNAQDELAVQEAKNRKILEGFERRQKLAGARIDAGASDAIANIRTTQLSGGIVGEGGQAEINKVELAATEQRIALKRGELVEIKKLRDQRVISEKEAADRTLAVEADLREQRSRLIDLQVQEATRAIQKEVDAQQRASDAKISAIEAEKVAIEGSIALLDVRAKKLQSEIELQKSISDLRQSTLKGSIDRASEAGDLQKQLASGEGGFNTRLVAQQQLNDLGFSGKNELQILQQKQALQAEADRERIAALLQQQQLERQSLQLSFEKEKQQAKINLLDREATALKAQQNLIQAQGELQKAKLTGDANQIANAQAQVDINSQLVGNAQSQLEIQKQINGSLDEQLQKQAQITDIQQQQARQELQGEVDRNNRQRQLDEAKLKDQTGIGGGASSSTVSTGGLSGGGNALNLFGADIGAYDRGSEAVKKAIRDNESRGRAAQESAVLSAIKLTSGREQEFAKLFADRSGFGDVVSVLNRMENLDKSGRSLDVTKAVTSASTGNNSDVVAKLDQLLGGIERLANNPRSLTFNSQDPVSDYADFMNKNAGAGLRNL